MVLALLLSALAAPINLTAINEQQGHVVLVNFWATWCVPCREEFPDLVRPYEEHQGRGLTIISVSMDDSENEDQARAFLEAHGAPFPAHIADTDNLKAFLEAMDPSWTGAIPTTFVFDRHGERAYGHIGQLSYQDMAAQLDGAK